MAAPTTTNLTKDTNTGAPTNTQVAILDDNYFESLESAPSQPGQKENTPAFVGLYHEKSKPALADAMKAQNAQLNTFYLSYNGMILPLNPFKYYLFESKKFFTKQDASGKILDVKANDPGDRAYSEHGFALVLVQLPSGELVPARYQARGGQYNCLKSARQMFDKAKDDPKGFAGMGDSFAVAAILPLPARVTATASAQMQKSAASGFDYIKGTCTTAPTKIEAGKAFESWWSKTENRAALSAVRGVYTRNVSDLEKRVSK